MLIVSSLGFEGRSSGICVSGCSESNGVQVTVCLVDLDVYNSFRMALLNGKIWIWDRTLLVLKRS